jgi:type I restriction enzyme S subunit
LRLLYSNALTDAGLYGFCSYADHKANSITVTARGTLGVAHFRDHPFTAIGRVLVLEPKDASDGRYFADYINYRINFAVESTGVSQLTAPQISKYLLPVPTETEQRAIAAALSDVDALVTALDKLIAKKRAIKTATMQQLLAGKQRLPGLVKKKGYKQSEVGVVPVDWDTDCLGEKTTKVGSGITPTGGERIYKNVGWGSLELEDIAFIDNITHEAFSATEIKVDDVFLNITGASIGRSAVADERVARGNVNQHVCIIRVDQGQLNPRFLNCFLLSSAGQRQIDSFQAGGNRQGLNFGQIRALRVPLPPLPEQRAIATILSDMDAEIAALEARRDKTKAIKQGMMQELLTGKTRLIENG